MNFLEFSKEKKDNCLGSDVAMMSSVAINMSPVEILAFCYFFKRAKQQGLFSFLKTIELCLDIIKRNYSTDDLAKIKKTIA